MTGNEINIDWFRIIKILFVAKGKDYPVIYKNEAYKYASNENNFKSDKDKQDINKVLRRLTNSGFLKNDGDKYTFNGKRDELRLLNEDCLIKQTAIDVDCEIDKINEDFDPENIEISTKNEDSDEYNPYDDDEEDEEEDDEEEDEEEDEDNKDENTFKLTWDSLENLTVNYGPYEFDEIKYGRTSPMDNILLCNYNKAEAIKMAKEEGEKDSIYINVADRLERMSNDKFEFARKSIILEHRAMELIESIALLSSSFTRNDALNVAKAKLNMCRLMNADSEIIDICERVAEEFQKADDSDYEDLKDNIFKGK